MQGRGVRGGGGVAGAAEAGVAGVGVGVWGALEAEPLAGERVREVGGRAARGDTVEGGGGAGARAGGWDLRA